MPKFVSGSSGQVYDHKKTSKRSGDEEIDEASLVGKGVDQTDSIQKPSAINKRGTKEKQKNSLDLFKEELRRLHEERDEQRNKIKNICKNNSKDSVASIGGSKTLSQNPSNKPQPVPVPLKPDPRCPTTLTLQVNLNPKDRDSSIGGSYDNGDPSTTNIYLGNINPTVNENDLCDVFGKFGPLASIKIMWPRTDEDRARNRNSGFVAYMSRIDAERALKHLNGKEFRGYDMKLGWGKAVPIPQNPVYVPPELLKLTLPPPQSGLPFNGQLHEDDIKRGYKVPNPYPRPLPPELESQVTSNSKLKSMKEAYDEFIGVVSRSVVKVILPSERQLLDKIHKTIEYVIREGPSFEAMIIARENKNPNFAFLHDNQSQEHIYYRWKLYSILHGDDPYEWRTQEFRMFEGGPMWRPPPLNPYADGMPEDLLEKSTTGLELLKDKTPKRPMFVEKTRHHDHFVSSNDPTRIKGSLGTVKREVLGDLLRNLDPTKVKIGHLMMFCINHADAAKEIIDCIHESLQLLETPFQKKLARLYLVSDILHNCSAAVTNASYYREGFQSKLVSIFEQLHDYLINFEDRYKADKFKQKVLAVLGAWKEWTLYEDEFIIKLSDILLGIKAKTEEKPSFVKEEDPREQQKLPNTSDEVTSNPLAQKTTNEEDLDGEQVDDEMLAKCLEAKGLSLRWYKTLELSEDEEEDDTISGNDEFDNGTTSGDLKSSPPREAAGSSSDVIRFKMSKWETVDPNEVAEQVVTISKWEAMARHEEEEGVTDSSDSSSSNPTTSRAGDSPKEEAKSPADAHKSKRFKQEVTGSQ